MGIGIIAGGRSAAAGLPTPEDVAYGPSVCRSQIYLGHEAVYRVHMSIRESGLGLISSDAIKGATHIGGQSLVLGGVTALSARENMPSLLKWRLMS